VRTLVRDEEEPRRPGWVRLSVLERFVAVVVGLHELAAMVGELAELVP
jgi:hypothetical protein